MSINVADITVGSCYVTSTGQVRRVIERSDDRVEYEMRGKTAGAFSNKVSVAEDKFAQDVDREVSCDHDPDFSD